MKKVCMPGASQEVKETMAAGGYQIESFDPRSYFSKKAKRSIGDFISNGLSGYDKRSFASRAEELDRIYRERDPAYMKMAGDFIDLFRDFDLIVMGLNFIHPELLARELKNPIKIVGLIDDPHATYTRGIQYLWAFDGVFYISPSYMDNLPFKTAISRWRDMPTVWLPLCSHQRVKEPTQDDESFFRNRDRDLVYVGGHYTNKIGRLIELKRHFGSRIAVRGRWSFGGYSGFLRGLLGKPLFPYRVTSLSNEERTKLYWNTKIGFNMHQSGDGRSECGNARTYEVPAHGALLISDKGAADGHALIFEPNKEAVYYDTINDAIDLIEYYLNHKDERITIAKAGYERYRRDYTPEKVLTDFFQWATSIKKSV
ncbi:MAG: glycosyltransferase [Helicobacteraceae bacterium]|jgi:hypothetical protein|nr:glycosyltransferase [Helicobacteraceae bacterium]